MKESSQAGVQGGTRITLWLVLLMLFVGFGVRMLDLADAPLDFHPTRQYRDAVIARGIYYKLNTSADPSLRTQAIRLANASDYEPPILESLVAFTYLILGGEHLWIARVYSSIFWLVGGWAVFALARRHTGLGGAIAALGLYLFLPFSVIASRSFQPDPFMVMWTLLAIWQLDCWAEKHLWHHAALAGLFTGIAVLVKPASAPILGTVLFTITLTQLGLRRAIKDRQVWLIAGLSISLPVLFYGLMVNRSAGFVTFWALAFSHLLLQPSFYFTWLNLLSNIISVGLIFAAAVGVILLPGRFRWVMLAMWVGYIISGMLLPYQISTHDYYSLIFVPIMALSLSIWGEMFAQQAKQLKRPWQAALLGMVVLIVAYNLWMARGALISHDYRSKALEFERIGQSLPHNGTIVALTSDYGWPLKYYGWLDPVIWPNTLDQEMVGLQNDPGKLESFADTFAEKTKGARYFLVTVRGQLNAQPFLKTKLYSSYAIVHDGDGYILFDLERPAKSP